jgi:oxygen-independent coproporphyrinogen-3 oxidase
MIMEELGNLFPIASDAEITLEANPDDLSKEKIQSLKSTAINRLSIGVQSFFDDDLKYLNRIHSAEDAIVSVGNAKDSGFKNISIDLIYGIPTLSKENWLRNLEIFFTMELQHLSAYALTIEPKTALEVLISRKKTMPVEEDRIVAHFQLLISEMKEKDYLHYEISNFCREPFYSQHNKSYWSGEKYLGLGPSAHSFDENSRQWNISDITKYIAAINQHKIPAETEKLSADQHYNEYILTSLRTIWGINENHIKNRFGDRYSKHFESRILKFIRNETVNKKNGNYSLTDKGKLFADGIASDLFV